MPRPSFQFYPGDWRRNANLAVCSYEEQGVWLNIMCLMHDSEEYGVLRWSAQKIAKALRVKPGVIASLVDAGVMKGCDKGLCDPFSYTPTTKNKKWPAVVLVPATEGPIWYSSRMVKDEHVRLARANQPTNQDLTMGGMVSGIVTNQGGNYPPNYSANSKQHLSSNGLVTTLSTGEDAPW